MFQGTLTPEQVAARRHGIGGSDVKRIMDGELLDLWLEKTGRKEPEDLSRNLRVQLGAWTEPFNIGWYERETGHTVDVSARAKGPWADDSGFRYANLDGIVLQNGVPRTILEAKHTHAFNKPEGIIKHYFWQVQHEMYCAGMDWATFSVIYGNERWQTFDVERDEEAIQNMLAAEEAFWRYVERDVQPTNTGAVKVAVEVEAGKTIDLTSLKEANMIGDLAATWLKHQPAAKAFANAADGLKAHVPADVQMAHGFGLIVTRAKNGAASINPLTDKEKKKWALT